MTEDTILTESDSPETDTSQIGELSGKRESAFIGLADYYDTPPSSESRTIWQNRWVLVALVVAFVPVIVWVLLDIDSGHAPVPPESEVELMAMEAEMMPDNPPQETDEPGIYDAKFYTVDEVVFPDDELVIGIEVEGQACAYLLAGMNDVDQHIVHHELAGQQFAVTYCDKSDCIAVYDKAGTTAEIRNGGFSGETLWILYDGQRFEQDAEGIPLKNFPSAKTTWGDWKQKYPHSLVYVGLGMSVGPTLKDDSEL